MGYGDWIFLAVLLGIAVLGSFLGFGKILKFVTGGIIGIIISIVLCYCFGGMILEIPFVDQILKDLASHWAHIEWLCTIHLEIIIYYIVLFIIITLLRIIIVRILKGIAETDVLVMRIINKVLGAALLVFIAFILMGLVFQIITFIGGETALNFYNALATNANAIVRPLFDWNPMLNLISFITEIGK